MSNSRQVVVKWLKTIMRSYKEWAGDNTLQVVDYDISDPESIIALALLPMNFVEDMIEKLKYSNTDKKLKDYPSKLEINLAGYQFMMQFSPYISQL